MNAKQVVLAVAAAMSLAGCAWSPTPYYDQHFGEAVRTAKAQQTIDPEASANPDPVAGINGRAAKESMDRYHDSFKSPPKTFNVINIGGGLSAN